MPRHRRHQLRSCLSCRFFDSGLGYVWRRWPAQRQCESFAGSGPRAARENGYLEYSRGEDYDQNATPRDWGPETKGLAVSLVLDKDHFAIGEDIPLRMAL